MNKKDDQIFFKYTQGVEPINRKNKIKKGIKKIPNNIVKKLQKFKKLETTNEKKTQKVTNSQYLFDIGKTNKMLERGQIFIDKKIDFHGMILSEAEYEFQKNIIESYKQKKRCLLFVTGKGLHKQKNVDDSLNESPKLFYGKIRGAFLKWVKKPEFSKYILSIERASFSHGGDGAFYVYLRKNKN
jgi:DNA-nicking Smr family endonuclease